MPADVLELVSQHRLDLVGGERGHGGHRHIDDRPQHAGRKGPRALGQKPEAHAVYAHFRGCEAKQVVQPGRRFNGPGVQPRKSPKAKGRARQKGEVSEQPGTIDPWRQHRREAASRSLLCSALQRSERQPKGRCRGDGHDQQPGHRQGISALGPGSRAETPHTESDRGALPQAMQQRGLQGGKTQGDTRHDRSPIYEGHRIRSPS